MPRFDGVSVDAHPKVPRGHRVRTPGQKADECAPAGPDLHSPHSVEHLDGLLDLRAPSVGRDHAVPGDQRPARARRFIEQAVRVGEAAALRVHVHQRGAHEGVARDGSAREECEGVDGAAEPRQAQRGAGFGEGREGGGVTAEARGEERSRVEAEAVGVRARRGGELDQAIPVVQGGGRRGGVTRAEPTGERRPRVSRLWRASLLGTRDTKYTRNILFAPIEFSRRK
jgi:hypothetical protein